MKMLKSALIAFSLAVTPVAVLAQAPAAAPAASTAAKVALPAAPTPQAPKADMGQPVEGQIGIQPQVTELGERAVWMHDILLMPLITAISLFVLGLLLWVMARYRKAANPVPSKTTHNTFIEVIWTLIPVIILVGLAIPSIALLAAQYKPASKDAVTIKATGHQWYWSYQYPDHGGFEIVSNMMPEAVAKKAGEPYLLGADNRMVVPVDTEIKMITTSEDVIHSFAVPAFWTKMDAVPGRLNEVTFTVEKGKEGVYYGQCSELCGARHGFMPIAVEVMTKANFAQWIASKGGKMPGAEKVGATAPAPAAPVATPPVPVPAAAPAAPAAAPAAATK
jgi:cytochrome c oxidase subunit II